MLVRSMPERLLVNSVPELPAAPKISESPLATAVAVPDEKSQLAPVPQVLSVLPTQVSLFCAKAAAMDAFLKRTLAPPWRRRLSAVKQEFKELHVGHVIFFIVYIFFRVHIFS